MSQSVSIPKISRDSTTERSLLPPALAMTFHPETTTHNGKHFRAIDTTKAVEKTTINQSIKINNTNTHLPNTTETNLLNKMNIAVIQLLLLF